MAATYIDTSFLFKLYIVESSSEDAWEALINLRGTRITSWLSDVEMATSFHRTQPAQKARKVYEDYLADCASGLFSIIPLNAAVYESAVTLAEKYAGPFKLRSLDTLHLAIALRNNASAIATYDDRLAHAARAVGLHIIPA